MKEIWKDIAEFEGLYQISNIGRVKSLNYRSTGKENILKTNVCSNGYLQVSLYKNKKRFNKKVHILVWDEFGDSPRNGQILEVDHIDNNKFNNRIDNLQLLTHRENSSKAYILRNKTSRYLGVCWSKNSSKWVAGIAINGKLKHLGYFTSEEDASDAYQNALKNL